jgi:hypothetical protein
LSVSIASRQAANAAARCGEPGEQLEGHVLVGLVLEVLDGAAARAAPNRAGERRDRARLVAGNGAHGRLERERFLRDAHVVDAARDGRDQPDLVAVGERAAGLRVLAVDGVEQPTRLGAGEPERRPDVPDDCAVGELELPPAGPRQLAQTREEPHRHPHRATAASLPGPLKPPPCHVRTARWRR